jgi:hypothetical protein
LLFLISSLSPLGHSQLNPVTLSPLRHPPSLLPAARLPLRSGGAPARSGHPGYRSGGRDGRSVKHAHNIGDGARRWSSTARGGGCTGPVDPWCGGHRRGARRCGIQVRGPVGERPTLPPTRRRAGGVGGRNTSPAQELLCGRPKAPSGAPGEEEATSVEGKEADSSDAVAPPGSSGLDSGSRSGGLPLPLHLLRPADEDGSR